MKKILKQYHKAQDACSRADIECQKLAQLIMPYIHEDLRDDIFVFEQSGDGLVLEWENHNYTIDSVIQVISDGHKDIDMRNYQECPFDMI